MIISCDYSKLLILNYFMNGSVFLYSAIQDDLKRNPCMTDIEGKRSNARHIDVLDQSVQLIRS